MYGFALNSGINYFDVDGQFVMAPSSAAAGATIGTATRAAGGIAMRGTPHGRAALVGFSLGVLVGDQLDPYVIPEPSDVPPGFPEELTNKRKSKCQELLDKKNKAKARDRVLGKKLKHIKDPVKCCAEARNALDAMKEELDIRKQMDKLDCDSYLPTGADTDHSGQIKEKEAALKNAEDRVKEFCK
jgi:hypothetical protein